MHGVIRQSLRVAFGIVVLAIPLPRKLSDWVSIGIAALIHEGTTVLVVFNALRRLAVR